MRSAGFKVRRSQFEVGPPRPGGGKQHVLDGEGVDVPAHGGGPHQVQRAAVAPEAVYRGRRRTLAEGRDRAGSGGGEKGVEDLDLQGLPFGGEVYDHPSARSRESEGLPSRRQIVSTSASGEYAILMGPSSPWDVGGALLPLSPWARGGGGPMRDAEPSQSGVRNAEWGAETLSRTPTGSATPLRILDRLFPPAGA